MGGPVVIVKQGWLRGAKVNNFVEGTHIAFKGIPYAAPPVGSLRFADPQPPQPWTGIRDALQEGSKCAQTDFFTKSIVGDDDCLYLNVATTSLTGSRPVMVWIHGGAFVMGDGGFETAGPDYFMASGIVFVSINYRLGILGFLQLGHEAAPGNMGLKDQVAALKWVKENISQFGGDPNNVTIFGESAGGASVHYLLVSPLAKGLFHKAITQSGVVLNPWATLSETEDFTRRIVAALGRDITDPNEIIEYLRTVPAHKLIEVHQEISPLEFIVGLELPFGPAGLDNKSVEPFMPRPYEELVAEGFDVPVIIGYNSHEGLLFLLGLKDEAFEKLDENLEVIVPRDLAAKAPSKVSEIAAEIRKFYFGDKPITKDLINEFVQCCGDIQFGAGIHKVVEIQSQKKSPTYFYRFSYDSPNSPMKKIFQLPAKGTIHAEEIQYLFTAPALFKDFKFEPGSTEERLRDRFIRMWTDFAKTGNPTPSIDDLITEKWKPVTKTANNYMEINAELSSGVNLSEDMWQTWKRIYAMAADQ